MTRPHLLTCLTASLLIAAGCSADDGDGTDDQAAGAGTQEQTFCEKNEMPETDDYVANLEKLGEGGLLTFTLVSSDPAPPARNDNRWVIGISDAAGAAVEGATLQPNPNMPQHGHGSNKRAEVSELGGGEYELNPVNLFMPGYWEVPVAVTTADGVTDSATFAFCVNP